MKGINIVCVNVLSSSLLSFLPLAFSFAFLALFTFSKFGFEEALFGLVLLAAHLLSFHSPHFLDTLLDHFHVPEDGEMVLST